MSKEDFYNEMDRSAADASAAYWKTVCVAIFVTAAFTYAFASAWS